MDARVSIQGRKLIGKGCWDRFKREVQAEVASKSLKKYANISRN